MTGVRSLAGYLALSPADRLDVMRAFVWLTLVDVGLRTVGFHHLVRQARIRGVRRVSADGRPGHGRAQRCAHWIEVAARHHVVSAPCLKRSLALHHWLCWEGLPSALRIGVRKEGGELKAHAWVEYDGRVINDRPEAAAAFTQLAVREAAIALSACE